MKYKNTKTFQQFTTDVNVLMSKRYGLEPNDFDSPSESMQSSYEGGESPSEYVKWYNNKYGPFARIDQIQKGY